MAPTSPYPVVGQRLRLRLTGDEDLAYVMATEAEAENRAFVELWSESEHRVAIEDPDTLHLVAVRGTAPQETPVAYVILQDVRSASRSIFLRRVVVSDKGVGYGREVCALVLRHCFQDLGAHRVWLNVQEDNEVAIRLYQGLGFTLEGTTRDSALHDGRFSSMYLYGMLEDEFLDVSDEPPDGDCDPAP